MHIARHYSEFGGTIDDNPDDHIDTMTKEVCNILEMHRVMLDRYRQLSDKGGISTEDIAFRGFDKGEEAAQYLYITFLLDKLGRYKESKSDDYDSGKPLLNKYQGMLEQWNISKDKHNLTAEDLRRITGILA